MVIQDAVGSGWRLDQEGCWYHVGVGLVQANTMHSRIIQKLEDDLKPVLTAIEKRGLLVDTHTLRAVITDLKVKRGIAESKTYESLGTSMRINLNSSSELAALFTDLKIGEGSLPTTRSGMISTAKHVLERIEHPAIAPIIEYRSLVKLIAALESYYQAIDMIDNRLYYVFTNECPSGRLYTKDMSVQIFPHEGRSAIIPEDGKVFVSADYDSFELKILSALAGDKYFRECWDKGIDLHRKVVSDMKGIPYEQVNNSLRALGKVLNFGLAYGQKAGGLARKLKISQSEAQGLISKYEKNIPEICRFKEDCIKNATECGYAETYFGRKRFLPDLVVPGYREKEKAQRQAVNHTIQGTASDIVKTAMLKLHEAGFQIDTMVHDSVLVSVFETDVVKAVEQIRNIMEVELKGLRLTVSIKVGKSWGDCK